MRPSGIEPDPPRWQRKRTKVHFGKIYIDDKLRESMKKTFTRATPERSLLDVETSLSVRNKRLIQQFLDSKKGYITPLRQKCLSYSLVKLADTLEKDLDKVTKEEMTTIGALINESKLSIKSKQDHVSDIKQFYKFLLGEGEFFPKVVASLKRPKTRGSLRLPEEMLSEDQIYAIIKACNNPRDKFYVALIFLDGGLRPVEVRNIKWGDVRKDAHGYFITIRTAKGSGIKETRTVRIIKSEPYFIQWNQNYPQSKDDENYLFVTLSDFQQVSKSSMESLFKRLKKKLKFKGRLYQYLGRHSLLTRMSKDPRISPAVLKKFAGHSLRSNTISEYQHFGDDDLKDMQLQYNGLQKPEIRLDTERKPLICFNCKKSNEFDAEFCSSCNYALTQKRMVGSIEQQAKMKEELEIVKAELERRRKFDIILEKLSKKPELIDELAK